MIRAFFLGLLLCAPAAARAASCPAVLPAQFSACRVETGVPRLTAGEEYLKAKAAARGAAVAACGDGLAAVAWPGGGELWSVNGGAAARVSAWNDLALTSEEIRHTRGRWFAYLGGQVMSGGDAPYSGFSSRLGTTLFKDRYDASVGYSSSAPKDAPDSVTRSLEFTGRELFPFTRHSGLNAGARLSYSKTGDLDGEWTPSVVGGLSIYLPEGSLDLNLTLGEQGSRSLQIGYTVYFRSAK